MAKTIFVSNGRVPVDTVRCPKCNQSHEDLDYHMAVKHKMNPYIVNGEQQGYCRFIPTPTEIATAVLNQTGRIT